ncbi:MAG: hydantoinase/oxoprolinase family protein [Paracoccaceae bacterium]|nr:hydantoinase/oxoprolinase family protein [Paracoccaceae bacterium]MDG1738852.1 hydantoinase/oxoprolinase family protein [Paracoccaceae bacterium]MDG2259517.1 hydantoinase/oxoprolinase family protein [Paracoccaceae bacterium]
MSLLLGVDTGGTYTDAVLIRDEKEVIASAKSLTTKRDLAIGIGGAVEAVLAESGIDPSEVSLASLSTTLATNALVEGQGGRVGLVYIGFREKDLVSHGLSEVLNSDPALVLTGGHDHAGGQAAALDVDTLRDWLQGAGASVSGYGVASVFATRNPAHELEVARIIAEVTGRPVSLSHQLSAKLNGPKRALTAVLNARLIGMIDRLISKAQGKLADLGITAPLMVVRGDGALISAAMARERPIETILSGPAASIVGARWMTGADEALVSDIGGTTTDVAVLRKGKPAIDPAGARVGPYRTMVEAVAMRTTGLGGDSEVHFVSEGLKGGVTLGPRRLMPISLIAIEAPEIVHEALDIQMRSELVGEHDARFVRAVPGVANDGLGSREETLLGRIGEAVWPLGKVLSNRLDSQALKKLVARGLVQVAGVTPSDASHVLGRVDIWDREASEKALELFGRRRTGSGNALARDPAVLAQIIVDRLTYQTGLALLECAFAEEEQGFGLPEGELARHVLTQRGLIGHRGLTRVETGLAVDVVGLGASAASYYPAVGELLGCRMILPEHAGVANAIGAVVGRVTMRKMGTVTCPSEGRYRVHFEAGPEDFGNSSEALAALEARLKSEALADAIASGAEDIHVQAKHDVRTAEIEGKSVFVEAMILVEASGRPRIAV